MDLGILQWLIDNGIKNEKGDLIEFYNHPFLVDIYDDQSQNLVVMKAAQVGLSTLEFIKMFYDSMRYKMDLIYTLPTDNDVRVMVGGKFNRIIANNPCMLKVVRDKDSVEQKQTGKSMIYFRGSWTAKTAISVTADRLCHDEKDASRLDVIADYQARLQHSKFKQTHTFSHPSLPEVGVDIDWLKSDQKHWMIKCNHCNHRQYLSWDLDNPDNMSIDIKRGVYICKKCKREIPDWVRICGEWVPKYKDREWSGYWVSLLMAPWMSAKEVVDKFNNKDTTDEFFTTKILGLPYADASSKLLRDSFFQNLTGKPYAPDSDDRVVIGIDTGLKIDYVIGNKHGLFYHGECKDYAELDRLMKRWNRAVAVIDSGGDLIGSRAFFEKWTGRVYLCALTGDRNAKELVTWKKGDECGFCTADRNRMIQLVIDEFRKKRIPVHGTEDDWYEYWEDWNALSKMKVLDPDTKVVKGYKWVRSGRDHRALATVFWRVGMMRFAGMGAIIDPDAGIPPANSYNIVAGEAQITASQLFGVDVEGALDQLEDNKVDW